MEHYLILFKTYVDLEQNHSEALEKHDKNLDMAIEHKTKTIDMLKFPPHVNFTSPMAKAMLQKRDEHFYRAGETWTLGQFYEALAGDSKNLRRDSEYLKLIGAFCLELEEQIWGTARTVATLKMGLHKVYPEWNEAEIDMRLSRDYPRLMENLSKLGLKVSLHSGDRSS
jgi:hypothetical protein